MNLQNTMQPKSSANGFNHGRIENDMADKIDKSQSGKFNPMVTGHIRSNKGKYDEIPSRDRLLYISTCLIGLNVEVQVKNGSIFSGIFHATNTDKDFGIILKMAHIIKDASSRGQKVASDTVNKAPSKTQIIPAQELVQIIAKDVPLTKEGLCDELQHENQELLLDSYISKSRHIEEERQLKRWVPDEDNSHCPELENIFDNPWTGSWDQFKVNENLFGVKSTFNEELYTTKLQKGPHMRKIEEEALRIAREIEGEDTNDLHLAEERGVHGNYDIDEETKYSSVFRGVDDSGYTDEEAMMDTHNNDTFGDLSPRLAGRSFADVTSGKIHDEDQVLSRTSSMPLQSSQTAIREHPRICTQADEHSSKSCNAMEHDLRIKDNHVSEGRGLSYANDCVRTQAFDEVSQTTRTADLLAAFSSEQSNPANGISFAASTMCSVSDSLTNGQEESSSASTDFKENARAEKVHVASHSKSPHGRPSGSASSTLERRGPMLATSSPALSPSSSLSSLSSEKSTLNPNAKEFKFDPNAKSFSPSKTPLRPLSPVAADNSYFPATVQSMHGMHVGVGVGPSFPGPQQMMYNPPAVPMQSPQMYFPPNGPQYGQPMAYHPRQVTYMPSYSPEIPYKRREF